MIKTRFTALALAAATALTPLAAQAAEIEWLQWFAAENTDGFYDELVADFEAKHPDITVKLVTQPFGKVRESIVTDNAIGVGSDVLGLNMPWTKEFLDIGILEPLDEYLARDDNSFATSDLVEAPLGKIDGHTWMVPLNAFPFVMHVNMGLVRQAGFDAPPATWEELAEQAGAISALEDGISGIGMPFSSQPPSNGPILTFLPLCHAAERIISVATPIRHGITINIAESGETFNADIQEVAPTFIFAVPRVWEKFYSRISFIMNDATAFGRFAYTQALKVAERRAAVLAEGKKAPLSLSLLHKALDFLVLRNIRVELGLARAHTIVSGAAPISARLLSWFNALGVSVQEAYGQTETGIVTATVPGQSPIGSIGRAMRGVEAKLAEDGEILIRARSNFSGYLSQPEKTAETMVDGWVHTGDVGKMDDNCDLTILDRKKDIIITAGGKNITPSQLENELKFSPYISDAVIIGDKRKYLTVLIMIDQETVEKYAQDKRIPFSNYKSLCESEPIIELIGNEVDRANSGFSPVEQVKKFRLIDVLLTAEDEELTPTMKLKRNEVERKYKDLIDTMY